jgi:hypothetical protein
MTKITISNQSHKSIVSSDKYPRGTVYPPAEIHARWLNEMTKITISNQSHKSR